MIGGDVSPLTPECPGNGAIEINVFDECEIHTDCTVEIWRNSVTGQVSIGWWENKHEV